MNIKNILLTAFILLSITLVVQFLVIVAEYYEKKWKRSKFIEKFKLSATNREPHINFIQALAVAKESKVSNSEAAKSLDQLIANLVITQDDSLNQDELNAMKIRFSEAAQFETIPEDIKIYIDRLKNLLQDDNRDITFLEIQLLNNQKILKRHKRVALLTFIIGLIGTIYTILSYYKI
jgi:hypothetical protein